MKKVEEKIIEEDPEVDDYILNQIYKKKKSKFAHLRPRAS